MAPHRDPAHAGQNQVLHHLGPNAREPDDEHARLENLLLRGGAPQTDLAVIQRRILLGNCSSRSRNLVALMLFTTPL